MGAAGRSLSQVDSLSLSHIGLVALCKNNRRRATLVLIALRHTPAAIILLTGLSLSMNEQPGSSTELVLADPPQCPVCRSAIVRRSRRRNLRDRLMSILSRLPYRCEDCDLRFYGSPTDARNVYFADRETAK
jgi:hypothetical protein